jgi:hypothetical protein
MQISAVFAFGLLYEHFNSKIMEDCTGLTITSFQGLRRFDHTPDLQCPPFQNERPNPRFYANWCVVYR